MLFYYKVWHLFLCSVHFRSLQKVPMSLNSNSTVATKHTVRSSKQGEVYPPVFFLVPFRGIRGMASQQVRVEGQKSLVYTPAELADHFFSGVGVGFAVSLMFQSGSLIGVFLSEMKTYY